MRRLSRWAAAALTAFVVLSSSAFAASENDAGKGGDASDAASAPTLVAPGSSFFGTLHPSDADWYAPSGGSTSPSCLKATARSYGPAGFTVQNGGSTFSTTIGNWQYETLSVAGSGTSAATGFTNADADHWSLYQFSVRSYSTSELGPADAGTGTDAGSTSAGAIPVTAGCFAGSLNPSTLDTADSFTIAGDQGERMVLSLAAPSGAPVVLRLFDPNGFPVGSPVSADSILDVTLPASGTYTLTTSVGSFNNLGNTIGYVVAIVGDPGSSCRPNC